MKNTIHVERAKLKISQTQLAEKIGITCGTICKIEREKCDPKVSTALKIAKFFGLPVDKIFSE